MNKKKMIRKVGAVLLIGSMILPSVVNAFTYEELIEVKETAHEIAEQARSINLPETHDIIVSAKEVWHEADTAIKNEDYEKPELITYYSEEDINLLAKVAFCEARGINSKTEIACVMWTIINRHDAGYGSIKHIVTAPNQYAYYKSASTVSGHGYDLKELAQDVLDRWNQEKNGFDNVGRVLPKDYLWFTGDGNHNHFRNKFKTNRYWDYSLTSPYES